MYFDFSAFLVAATLGSGVIALVDRLFWRRQRLAQGVQDEPLLIEYARSFFPVLLFVLILRSFVVEPFRIPSGSMKPTLQVGDFIAVNKYAYGLRLPVFNTKVYQFGEPQRGDVMVFRYPVDPTVNFIKRVIGVPGDLIEYRNKLLYVNGTLMGKDDGAMQTVLDEAGNAITVRHWQEDLGNVKHEVYERLTPGREVRSIRVPEGHYFMMGDNRDDSDDSRAWGFVPEENIIGKAFGVWMSWDSNSTRIRFDTIPRAIV